MVATAVELTAGTRAVGNGSNSLGEADASPVHLCPVCLRKLHLAVGFEPVKRHQSLAQYYGEHGLLPQSRWVQRRADRLASP